MRVRFVKTGHVFAALGAIAGMLATVTIAVASEPARVAGTIVDERSGSPLGGAAVNLRDETGASRTVTTNARGQFFAIGLLPGRIVIAVENPGREPRFAFILLAPGASATCFFRVADNLSTIDRLFNRECRIDPDTSDTYNIL